MEVRPVNLHCSEKPDKNQEGSTPPLELSNKENEVSSVDKPEVENAESIHSESEASATVADDEKDKDEEKLEGEDDYEPYEPYEPALEEQNEQVAAMEENINVYPHQKDEQPNEERYSEEQPKNEEYIQQEPENNLSEQEYSSHEASSEEHPEHPKPLEDDAVEDEYDPEAVNVETEVNVQHHTAETEKAQDTPFEESVNNVGLPPKPTHQTQDSSVKFKEAYEAIMQSDIVKDPLFTKMSQEEQMNTIRRLLQERNITLPQLDTPAIDPDMNYDQVYSYNKPFKNIKDPIPLVPVGKYCRRPNITRPMTAAEHEAYETFLANEAQHSGWQSLEDLPENLRLFIGNLPANTITKEDLFRIFSQYGEVLQISIKAGYGFVQYRTAEACAASIKGETNVPLHNKYMRLAASKSQKNRAAGSRGRERSGEEFGDENDSKRRRTNDCQLIRNEETSGSFFNDVEAAFKWADITYTVIDATGKNVSDEVREVAYLGVIGACVVKQSKIDLQTFEETPDGGIKFDEYVDVDTETVLDVINKAKSSRQSPQRDSFHDSRRRDSRRPDSHHGSSYFSRGDRGHGDNRSFGRNQNWQRPDHEWSQSSRPLQRSQWSRQDERSYNEPPSYQRQGPNQLYGGPQNFNQDFGPPRGYNQGYPPNINPGSGQQIPPGPPQGYPNPGYSQQRGFQGYGGAPPPMPPQQNFSQQAFNMPQQRADPALLQTLQNLDPGTMQNVISLLQQNKGPSPQMPNAQPQYQGYGLNPPPQPNVTQPNQLNSLLSSLQSNQGNYNSNQQQQVQTPSSALMDMLARLGK